MAPKKLLALVPALTFLLCLCAAADEYVGSVRFDVHDFSVIEKHGLDFVLLRGAVTSGHAGAPALPAVQRDLAVPWDAAGFGVRVLSVETLEIEGNYDLAPMTRPQPISSPTPQENPFIKDPAIYSSDASYPGVIVEELAQWNLVGQRFLKLKFHPVQYHPISGKVTLATQIEFAVSWTRSARLDPPPTFNLTAAGKADYLASMKRNVLNPGSVVVPSFRGSVGKALPSGQYEHVIITPQAFENDWSDLVDWHNRKGLPDVVVTREYIYANYTGSNQNRIRSFVADAHATWGTRYFLIGADGGGGSNEIPYHERYLLGEYVPNDTYYADYDGDWVVDVHVGRASVTGAAGIQQFMDKVLYYEKTPPLSQYGKEVFFMGFDLDSHTAGEETKEFIETNDLPGTMSFQREYDKESGSHLSDVIAYLDQGPNLVNHIDHCNWNVWGMGYTNHGESMYDTEVNGLANGWKLINWYSLGCLASAWDYGTGLSETFMRKVGGGGVSFTGNTRYGWYAVGYIDLYSSLYDIRWWHVLFTDNAYHVGETLTEHKNDYYPDDDYYQYVFSELNLLGDPAMPLWMDDPAPLTVTCDDPVFTGSQSYPVHIDQGGSAVEDALVCLLKEGEVYVHDLTDASGDVNFTIDPATQGILYITVTAQDSLPHEGEITVSENAPPVISSITPEHGAAAGGTACTISGFYFTSSADTTVTFDTTSAGNVNVVDANTLTCEAPAHATGSVGITMTNSNGSDTLPGAFTYHAPPQVTSIDPDNGPITGGTSVTLTGSDFTEIGVTSVTFDGLAASSVTVVDATTLTCLSPAHSPGIVDVQVINDFGADTLGNGFVYNDPPSLTSVSPFNGPVAGGTEVTVTGSHLTGTTTVTFGGTVASNIIFVNAGTLTCDSPAHASGVVDVTVSNINGSDTLPGAFTFHDVPHITSLDPDSGPMAGGTFVTLTGSDFTEVGATSVTFGSEYAADVLVVDATTITCTTPAHTPGLVDVTVINDFGSDTLSNGYAYNFPPEIVSIDPTSGPVAGGTAVTVTGNYFTYTADTEVTFGGKPANNIEVVDATTITCTSPPHMMGAVYVDVTNSNGSEMLPSAFIYHDPPSLASVNPDHGLVAGGSSVTLTGDAFTAGDTEVYFGGELAADIVVVDASTLTCTTPAYADADIVDVEVINPYGSDRLSNAYFYLPATGSDPLNLTDVDTLNLNPDDVVTHAVTGPPGALYMLFLSFGGGPVNSPWGVAGLDVPIYYVFMGNLGVEGYATLALKMPATGLGFMNFYTQSLVDNAPPMWATGGNNPNGTGSILWGLN